MNHNVNIIDKLYIVGRGIILVVHKDNYHINDTINNRYLIRGIEYAQFSNRVGLIVIEKDESQ